jgi:hypothetical protein
MLRVPLPLEESAFFHVVMRRHATREIAKLTSKPQPAPALTWAIFGNHWPSRSGGQFEPRDTAPLPEKHSATSTSESSMCME